MSRQRVLHIIRHAESELNVISAHANAGYFEGVTGLDSKLSSRGVEQAKELGRRISQENPEDPYLLRQAQVVVTSPLSRAMLTARYAMPVSQYNYKVKPWIAEQVENTTDIPLLPAQLSELYPDLSLEFAKLPDAWWWRHPDRRGADIETNPELDAKLLVELRGKSPASESKYNLRGRGLQFLKWLYSDEPVRSSETLSVRDTVNVAAFSHACTIRELELLLMSVNGTISEADAAKYTDDDEIRNNTEQITYNLPFDTKDVDWDLLERRVELCKNVPNHADFE